MIVIGLLAAFVLVGVYLGYRPDKSRAELEARYRVSPADYVEAAGIRLRVRDTGPKDAPAVVFLHGFGSSLETWEAWAETLSRDYRVVRYDLPGFGLSGPDPTGDYSDARGIEVLAALLDALGVTRASLIGNSIGGKIAWKFAAQYPARIEKLVLISPDGFASPGFEYGKKAVVPATIKIMPYVLPKMLVRMSLAPAYGDATRISDALVTRYWDMMLAPGVRKAMIARLGQTVLEDPEPVLARIQTPTLLIWGRKDGMIPFTNAADFVRALPHNTLIDFPGLGHVPQEEAPAESVKPVVAFLAGETAGDGQR